MALPTRGREEKNNRYKGAAACARVRGRGMNQEVESNKERSIRRRREEKLA